MELAETVDPRFGFFTPGQMGSLGVARVHECAFELALNTVRETWEQSRHLDTQKKSQQLRAIQWRLFDDSQPGAQGKVHIIGPAVLVPFSLANRVMGSGYDAVQSLIRASIDNAELKVEDDDPSAFAWTGQEVVDMLEQLREPEGKRNWRLRAAGGDRTARDIDLDWLVHPQDFWAVVGVGYGKTYMLYDHLVANALNPTQPSACTRHYVRALAQHPGLMGPDLHARVFGGHPLTDPEMRGLIKIAKAQGIQGEGKEHFLRAITWQSFMAEGSMFALSQDQQIDAARALWRWANREPIEPWHTELLFALFLADVFRQADQYGPEHPMWRQTETWLNQLAPDHKTDELLALADSVMVGLAGTQHLPQDDELFLNRMFISGAKTNTHEVWSGIVRDELVEEVTDRLIRCVRSQGPEVMVNTIEHAVCATRLQTHLLERVLERMEQRLGSLYDSEILGGRVHDRHYLGTNAKLARSLCGVGPRAVHLVDHWWRQHHIFELSDPRFMQAWNEWTEKDNPHVAAIRAETLAAWRRQALLQQVEVDTPTHGRARSKM